MYRVFLACVFSTVVLVAQAPALLPMIPSSGLGSEANLTLTIAITNGAQNLADVRLMVQNEVNGEMACYLSHDPATRTLRLRNDTDSAWGAELSIGSLGSDSNSQCRVSATASSVDSTSASYTLKVHLHFSSRFAGGRRVWAQAVSRDGLGASRWTSIGEWVVPAESALPRQVERYRTTDPDSKTIALSRTPDLAAELRVYRNGLLLAPGDDYSIDYRSIVFRISGAAGDLIQVDYSPVCSAP